MKKFAFGGVAAALTSLIASTANAAGGCTGPGCDPTLVPEISALEGTAAIAALAAIVLLTWERRRRAA
ncbi:MAG: hypothetical protein Q4G49_06860 [Paracoccus sp. (in: a-proteobacteria)]|nr:hypothetical protein [Paracoccus sp. (in: a-proteobacteria)]